MNPNATQSEISKLCSEFGKFLEEKNRRYGNSALEPLKIFSYDSAEGGLMTRIDDKLSRIKNSTKIRKNDVVDLTGYLMLYCLSRGWTDFQDLID